MLYTDNIRAAPAALFQNPAKPTPVEIARRLVMLEFKHHDFEYKTKSGIYIIHELLVQDVQDYVRKAWEIGFPIHQAISPAEYGWCDKASCAANNSSAHNMRYINGTKRLSKHAGSAFDTNPLQNPCFEFDDESGAVVEVIPELGAYDPRRRGTLYRAHPLVQLMLKRGWAWGGNWTNPFDPQHFQKVLPELEHLYT